MGGWDDYEYYQDEAAKEAFIDETLRGISEDSVRSYLGQNGDAIDQRVGNCIRHARELHEAGFFQAVVVSATTAIELIVRFLLIHPLIQAAFLSEEWAYLLTQRIASGRTVEDRKLLPKILEHHRIDIAAVLLEKRRRTLGDGCLKGISQTQQDRSRCRPDRAWRSTTRHRMR